MRAVSFCCFGSVVAYVVCCRAVEQDKSNNLQAALDLYRQAIALFQAGLKGKLIFLRVVFRPLLTALLLLLELEPGSRTRATTEAKLTEYETRRDQIIVRIRSFRFVALTQRYFIF